MPKSLVIVLNVGYRSTNYWVISGGRSRLLVDLGWPGSMGTMRGLAQDLKNAGVPLLVIDLQIPFIPLMKRYTKPQAMAVVDIG